MGFNSGFQGLNCVPDAVSNMASIKKEYINFCSQHTYCQLLNDKLQHVSA